MNSMAQSKVTPKPPQGPNASHMTPANTGLIKWPNRLQKVTRQVSDGSLRVSCPTRVWAPTQFMVEVSPMTRFRIPATQIQGNNGNTTGTIRPITAKNSMTWRAPSRSISTPP